MDFLGQGGWKQQPRMLFATQCAALVREAWPGHAATAAHCEVIPRACARSPSTGAGAGSWAVRANCKPCCAIHASGVGVPPAAVVCTGIYCVLALQRSPAAAQHRKGHIKMMSATCQTASQHYEELYTWFPVGVHCSSGRSGQPRSWAGYDLRVAGVWALGGRVQAPGQIRLQHMLCVWCKPQIATANA